MSYCEGWSGCGCDTCQGNKRIAELEAEVERLLGLLDHAACPSCDGSGGYTQHSGHDENGNGYTEVVACQWCDERAAALGRGK